MENIIIAVILVLLVSASSIYIWKEKKKGKCISCPAGGCANCKCCHGAEMTQKTGSA